MLLYYSNISIGFSWNQGKKKRTLTFNQTHKGPYPYYVTGLRGKSGANTMIGHEGGDGGGDVGTVT